MDINPFYQDEYLPSSRIANAGQVFDTWRAKAKVTQSLTHRTDLHYGGHKREVLDFYPALKARGCVVYIHGGYWMGFSKSETSWIVEGFLDQGLSVALINYPLCPEVKIADISHSCAMAMHFLFGHVLGAAERDNVVVTGHSAGGYLAAAMLKEDLPIKGLVSLSGVFDVTPLMQTSLQANLQLDATQAKDLNLLVAARPARKVPMVFGVGALESDEFKRQSREMAEHWGGQYGAVAGANHFSIVDDLASPTGRLNLLARQMAES